MGFSFRISLKMRWKYPKSTGESQVSLKMTTKSAAGSYKSHHTHPDKLAIAFHVKNCVVLWWPCKESMRYKTGQQLAVMRKQWSTGVSNLVTQLRLSILIYKDSIGFKMIQDVYYHSILHYHSILLMDICSVLFPKAPPRDFPSTHRGYRRAWRTANAAARPSRGHCGGEPWTWTWGTRCCF